MCALLADMHMLLSLHLCACRGLIGLFSIKGVVDAFRLCGTTSYPYMPCGLLCHITSLGWYLITTLKLRPNPLSLWGYEQWSDGLNLVWSYKLACAKLGKKNKNHKNFLTIYIQAPLTKPSHSIFGQGARPAGENGYGIEGWSSDTVIHLVWVLH